MFQSYFLFGVGVESRHEDVDVLVGNALIATASRDYLTKLLTGYVALVLCVELGEQTLYTRSQVSLIKLSAHVIASLL